MGRAFGEGQRAKEFFGQPPLLLFSAAVWFAGVVVCVEWSSSTGEGWCCVGWGGHF
jgi:hypothetical protein